MDQRYGSYENDPESSVDSEPQFVPWVGPELQTFMTSGEPSGISYPSFSSTPMVPTTSIASAGSTPTGTSQAIPASGVLTTNLAVETTTFQDSCEGERVDFATADARLFDHDKQESAQLGDFLKRPVLIYTYDWVTGGMAEAIIDPWSLYLSTTAIQHKLNNYSFFRGNLKIKVLINSSPFYYGALGIMYTPLYSYVPSIDVGGSSDLTLLSQRPHVWIYPQDNAGAEMSLPFFYYANYIRITTAADVAQLGRLHLAEYVELLSANGAQSKCTVQVYAWIEDPILMGPTTGLALQGGDEFADGPVSAPASAVALWASYLSKIPVIGRFAKATSIGARAVSSIASLFGWTNVPVIENVRPVKNLPFHDLCSASISEPTDRIVLDPKTELSVDPAIVGLDSTDEMTIPYIVSKESFMGSYTWATDDVAGVLLYASLVTPISFNVGEASAAGTTIASFSPMGYISNLFKYWRGDIIFRFKIIASKFHRGRFRITWDPLSTLTATDDYSHVAFTKIVDIGEETDVEFVVPYMQSFAWLELARGLDAMDGSVYIAPHWGRDNGSLTVRVLTELSAPVDTAPISLMVFIRGSENLEFADPRDLDFNYSLFEIQGDDEAITPTTEPVGRYLVNWGEAIPSLRLLARRSSLYDIPMFTGGIVATDNIAVLQLLQGRTPTCYGYDPNAYTTATGEEDDETTYPFAYVQTTPLRWIMSMYIAHRGSVRWHYNLLDQGYGDAPPSITIERRVDFEVPVNSAYQESVTRTIKSSAAASTSVVKQKTVHSFMRAGATGISLNNIKTQTGMAVEMPMMTNRKFYFANHDYALCGTNVDNSYQDTYLLTALVHPSQAKTGYSQLARYVSSGTDFNLHFFLNAPLVYYNTAQGTSPV